MTLLRASLAILLLAGCAQTSGTVEIPPEELPFSVARESVPQQTPAPRHPVRVFFVQGGRLVPATRVVQLALPDAEAAVRELLEGPTQRERSSGISSELVPEVRLLAVSVGDGTANVDLSGEFEEPAPSDRIALRVAQVVWTLTELPGIAAVHFSIDGESVAVTTPDGTAVDRPVSRADYEAVSPPG